ncbi:hypothetical protein SBA1_410021 [Candidatus Sulfotelmatobacter kueseliae]|uniref:Uncharacterized protein n=1 Tax=Candidatus Sulfotelmatobacter kueseliae TaxID=2042962 RepID=A0A2U3KQM7_9BACT|nr:hypothetical protein SBA1_410021 [Candidatus Sulfotelmatobacter kueseliae]
MAEAILVEISAELANPRTFDARGVGLDANQALGILSVNVSSRSLSRKSPNYQRQV